MLENNYMKIYAKLMIENVTFSSYKQNNSYIINTNENKIIVTDDKCLLNDIAFDSAEELIKNI
jgi:hypothetical protein